MSVVLENVRMAGRPSQRPLFDGLSLHVADRSRTGILGTSKSGKSTLLRLICGTKLPDDGLVKRDVRSSWPIPLSSFTVAAQTVARNIRFIARLYGIDDEDFPRRIADMVELTEFLNVPLGKCPKFARARLGFALGVGIDFDMYLFDGSFAPTDKPFKEKAAEISAARVADRGFIVATSVPVEVEDRCDSVYVLEEGRATYFAQPEEGIEHFKELLAIEKKKQRDAHKGEAEDEGDVELDDLGMTGIAATGLIE